MVQLIEVPSVEFLERMSKFPVISTAMEYAVGTYGKAKESNELIKRTLSTAEDTVRFAAFHALPVVQTLERPIHAVDSLACKTLDKVEEHLPIVKKTPDEILTTTKSFVNEKWQPLHHRADSVRDIVSTATNRILDNQIGRFALESIESSVDAIETYTDYYLPPAAGDAKPDEKEDLPNEPAQKLAWSVQRTFGILSKAQYRLSLRVQRSLHELGLNGLVYSGALVSFLDWIQMKWKETADMGMPERFQQLVAWFRVQYNVPASESTNLLDDSVFLVTALTKRVTEGIRTALETVARSPLPDVDSSISHIRRELGNALQLVTNFSVSLSQVFSLRDLIERANFFLGDFLLIKSTLKADKESADLQAKVMPRR